MGATQVLLGILGGLIVVLEGIQQIFQPHYKWLKYRTANERLKREHHLYEAAAGPYEDSPDPMKLLAVRMEDVIAEEHTKWASRMSATDSKVRTS